jgi:hypothetical protein
MDITGISFKRIIVIIIICMTVLCLSNEHDDPRFSVQLVCRTGMFVAVVSCGLFSSTNIGVHVRFPV